MKKNKKITSTFLLKLKLHNGPWPLYISFLITVFVYNELKGLGVNDKPNVTVGVSVHVGKKDVIVRMPNLGERASLQTI